MANTTSWAGRAPAGELKMHSVVMTHCGEVRGSVVGGINVFKGIPYAAPPFGANRFRPPQPVEPWSGVRDAMAFGPKAPQLPYPPPWDALLPELVGHGEDCLNLNVWSPDLGAAGLPVMVWMPGGQFESGTAAMEAYDGSTFARDGIVFVSINYRVGADGFLYLGEGNANFAILDQIAALEWVRENIAAFGGDPGKVTVFGESAGAICIGMMLSMPRAEGLFRRAILQSGGAYPVMSAAGAERVCGLLAGQLGVQPTREAIAAVPVERTLQAQAELRADLMAHPDPERWGPEVMANIGLWQPVVDGEIIPAPPLERIAAGAAGRIDLLAGSNLDEWNFFMVPGGAIDMITPEMLAGAAAASGLPADAVLDVYRTLQPHAGPGELLSTIQSDRYFRFPNLRLAEAHAMGPAATYMYEFAWRSPQFDGRLGACHGLDIPFVFDVIGEGVGDDLLLGANPPRQLAARMHSAWVAFAANGECPWPKYDLVHRPAMRFAATSEVVHDPMFKQRILWEGGNA